jgi:hypothetical protein
MFGSLGRRQRSGEATKQTGAMLAAIADGATLEKPALWPLEVANALLVLVRRRKLAADERQAARRRGRDGSVLQRFAVKPEERQRLRGFSSRPASALCSNILFRY